MTLMRLQKHIADMGICSRRKAEEYILAGKVKVNGKKAEIGMKVDDEVDRVEIVDREIIETKKLRNLPSGGREKIYVALNKPVDYITSTTDEQGLSVVSLITSENCFGSNRKEISERIYPVGRLDKDSEGLVLLTNDGEFTNILTHPRYEHEKEYEVTITKPLSRDAKKVLKSGMTIEDEFYGGMRVVGEFNYGRQVIINVILKEGKNRHIRKMFGRLGYSVVSLRRIRIGKLKLGSLPVGKWKQVKKEEIL